jgi:hypothetical protein
MAGRLKQCGGRTTSNAAGRAVGVAAVTLAVVCGCGASSSSHCPSSAAGKGIGTAAFAIDGKQAVTVTQDACPVASTYSGHPEISYSGPGGCNGRFFTTDFEGNLDFRYSSRDAYMV